MKFLRKVLATCLVIVFLISLIIGAGIILSVQNVNVRFIYYGDNAHAAEFAQTKENLEKLKGSGIVFISDEDIESRVTNSEVLTVESYTKVYPCSIDIVIRERVETFAISSDNGQTYSVLDECGKTMKSGVNTINGSDGCPNVLVSGFTLDDMALVAQMSRCFSEVFSSKAVGYSFRRLVGEVTTVGIAGGQAFEFVFRSGFIIRVHGYRGTEDNKLKLERAIEKYLSLSDAEKISGVIDVTSGKDGGLPTVVYPGYDGF